MLEEHHFVERRAGFAVHDRAPLPAGLARVREVPSVGGEEERLDAVPRLVPVTVVQDHVLFVCVDDAHDRVRRAVGVDGEGAHGADRVVAGAVAAVLLTHGQEIEVFELCACHEANGTTRRVRVSRPGGGSAGAASAGAEGGALPGAWLSCQGAHRRGGERNWTCPKSEIRNVR